MDAARLIMDVSIIGVFLVIGTTIRSKVPFFQRYVIPGSVIGGLIGLLFCKNGFGLIPTSEFLDKLPAVLIDVVFAGLFIGRKIPGFRFLAKTAGAQAAYAYINGFGQVAVGMLVVLIFGAVGVVLHPAFGVELVIAFQGGPGVATAVAPMFEKFDWPAAESAGVGEACAIAGLLLAVFVGIIIVNIARKRGMTSKKYDTSGAGFQSLTFLTDDRKRPVGTEVTSPEAANTLAFTFGFMGMAIIIGKLIVMGIVALAPPLAFLPTFPFVLVGGIFVQIALQKAGLDRYADRASVETVAFFALDVLIVASFMAINFQAIAQYIGPLLVMILLGLVFNVLQFFWLAPRILPGAWFEKGLCEYGQNTGSVPQALLLLRMADPRFETDAAEALALKMFLFSPFFTPAVMMLLPTLMKKGPGFFFGLFAALMLIVLVICRLVTWQKRTKVKWFGGTD